MGVSKDELVEIIEGKDAKLSLVGRELWEALELMTRSAPEEATPVTTPPPTSEEHETIRRMAELPESEQGILARLMELHAGLYSSEFAENRGGDGGPRRDHAVILAAALKDRQDGRQGHPDITPSHAAARLREPG